MTALPRLGAWTAAPPRLVALAGAMTLLLLLLYAEDVWYLRAGTYALAVAGLLYRPLTRSAAFWLTAAAFLTVGHAERWFQVDNHKYLITYWVLALGLAHLTPRPAEALRTSARLLVGFAFALAVLQKLLSPDYLSGSFFEALLVTDRRFAYVAYPITAADA